jgi:uncharacterized membrane protein
MVAKYLICADACLSGLGLESKLSIVNTPIGTKTDIGHEFYLKRNCSISPFQLAFIFIFLGIVSMLIGVIFYAFGATLILPFSLLEVFALFAAYFYNALHANDFERLRVDSKNVYFESKFGLRYCEEYFLKSLTRVLPSDKNNLINLSHGYKNIYFGRNIHSRRRSLLEIEIRSALKN